jgi:hypothetical protein
MVVTTTTETPTDHPETCVSTTRTERRPLPVFAKWSTGLWAFVYDGVEYFAAKTTDGWSVVPRDDESNVIASGHHAKEAAVRTAMHAIDTAEQTATEPPTDRPTTTTERRWGTLTYGTTPGGKTRHIIWGASAGKCGKDASGPDNPSLRMCQGCRTSYAALERRENRRRM